MNEADFTRATPEERARHIIRPHEQIPMTELVKGSYSHLVSLERLTVSFLTMRAGSAFELHTHPNEQCMIVIEGYCDELIGDKMYRVEKGDMIFLPPNTPHGAFIRDVDCRAIDIFVPRREDFLQKQRIQHPEARVMFKE